MKRHRFESPFVLGIDPGISGAFVLTDGKHLVTYPMPIQLEGKEKLVDFLRVCEIIGEVGEHSTPQCIPHVFLERAVPFAMGSKSAFSYGRGFEAILIALKMKGFALTLIEPSRWAKEMHEGISADLKPKVRSGIAVKRLYPGLVPLLPKKPKGGLHDGPIDALLIAGYGLRRLRRGRIQSQPSGGDEIGDFY